MRILALMALTALMALIPATAMATPTAAPPLSDKAVAALAGRTAGKPVACISLRDVRSTRIIDETAILYEIGAGKRVYLNRPNGGRCTSLKPWRTIVTRTPGTRLCRNDIVRVIDPPTPVEFGVCGLGEFVPYTR